VTENRGDGDTDQAAGKHEVTAGPNPSPGVALPPTTVASEVGEKEAAQRQPSIEERAHRTNVWMTVLTLVIAVVSIGQGYLTKRALDDSRNGSRSSEAASNDMMDKFERMTKAAEAQSVAVAAASAEMTRSNAAMETLVGTQNRTTRDSVEVAKKTAASSRETMIALSQPYLTFDIQHLKLDATVTPPPIDIGIHITNTGSTLARNATNCFGLDVQPNGPSMGDLEKCKTNPDLTPMDIAPNQPLTGHASGRVTELERDLLLSGDRKLFIIGWISYEDQFGHATSYALCFFWKPQSGAFSACTEAQQHGLSNE
jgi:hypothetical protein